MKFYETVFDDYLKAFDTCNFNGKNEEFIKNLQLEFGNLMNIIIYGPCGSGKYTQCLNFMKKYSESSLKYEKKMVLNTAKNEFHYKISDIHYEIDMELLGCNSKQLWNEVFDQIIDIITAKREPCGFIVCKNFHTIQVELLEIFYSYVQKVFYLPIEIRFILLTEHYSFIPDNIINSFITIHISKPTKSVLKKKFSKIKSNHVKNLKELYTNHKYSNKYSTGCYSSGCTNSCTNNYNNNSINSSTNSSNIYDNNKTMVTYNNANKETYEIFDKILNDIILQKNMKFIMLRENLYSVLIYNIDVNAFLWHILKSLVERKDELKIDFEKIGLMIDDIYNTLQLYNNNYRPIYHLEKIVLTLIKHIHGP